MNPLPNCRKFIQTTLAPLGTKVYNDRPPQKGAVYPCIVVSLYDHEALAALGEFDSLYELPVYTIKAVAQGTDSQPAHDLSDNAEELLKVAHGEVQQGTRLVTIQGVRGLNRIEYTETGDGGVEYRHVGRQYRLFASRFRRTNP